MKNPQPFITTDGLREEFEKRFPNIEVRIPDIEEYHTGKKAYDAIADFWLQKMSDQKERLIKEVEEVQKEYLKNYDELIEKIPSAKNTPDMHMGIALAWKKIAKDLEDILRRLQSV
jgi:hypothetical protein